ncbi:UBP1-associated proteins 1C [Ananas comosus]|uniref:UBP1-associated proteins 1C n=1 Tax=Ananas comosus TaxID=4615 RepID=A0A199UUD7_ANACO|nr:UBP1-associated proteins 1C [Ananas comosus]
MVWFQCEDCGENLKKPKLPNHFRICSAYKLSCIDCGEIFSQQSVQSHTQCISEAEKYGPKDQGRASHNTQAKPDKPKQNADVDINVGLSSHPPWFCSLCNTTTTSKQTLLLHAEGKKHRAKARAFHASQKQCNAVDSAANEKGIQSYVPSSDSFKPNGLEKIEEHEEKVLVPKEKESTTKRKREDKESDRDMDKNVERQNLSGLNNGEVIQAEESKKPKKKRKDHEDKQEESKELTKHKFKWKKIATSILKSNPDQCMKIKKLQKLVVKELRESGLTDDKEHLHELLMDKISTSSRFSIDKKHIKLVGEWGES